MPKLDEFKDVAEVEVDNRRRISLGRVGRPEHRRYLIQEAADGEIRLIPVVSIPAREMILLQRPDLVASLERGIADAEAGRLVDRGSFEKYLDEDDDD
jgi:hypothetical protein